MSSPSISPSSSPAPTTPTPAQMPDATLAHLLSLPPLLHPLSPPTAALHMARLRLLLSVPASPSYRGAGGLGASGWCHLCGGLRAGLGGAERGGRGPRASPTKVKGKGKGKGKGKALASSARARRGKVGASTVNFEDGQEQEQEPTNTSSPNTSSPYSLPAPSVSTNKRKKAECETCGAAYRRPRPDPATLLTFPSARTRRTRAAEAAAAAAAADGGQDVMGAESASVSVHSAGGSALPNASGARSGYGPGNADNRTPVQDQDQQSAAPSPPERTPASVTDIVHVPDNQSGQALEPTSHPSLPRGEQSSPSPTPSQIQSQSQPRSHAQARAQAQAQPALLSRPSLSHIPSSSPNLPTYPQPPARPTPPSSGGKSGTASAGAGAGGRKKKKSGLARLLAENKQREESGKSGWGL